MRYSRMLAFLLNACIVCIGHVAAFVGPLIVAPLMYLIRDAPAVAVHLFVTWIKPAAFRVLGVLSAEYRDSWLTDGQSLRAT
ncbi:hypothetical protein [Shinella sp. G-2]|uniref:hypothetical protein n=1 Tax=Shinella sp. G-2 TaxID=3133141 RepID=UPI003D04EB64